MFDLFELFLLNTFCRSLAKNSFICKAPARDSKALTRQLSALHFFLSDENDDIVAPKTNVGCEGAFPGLENDCKRAGRSTLLETLSNKRDVASNKLHEKERRMQLTDEETSFDGQEGVREQEKLKK